MHANRTITDCKIQAARQNQSQRGRILALLIEAWGRWVPLSEILALGSAQYNARLYELRRLGFRILNRTERLAGKRISFLRLEVGARRTIAPQDQPTQDGATLFGDLALETARHRDDG